MKEHGPCGHEHPPNPYASREGQEEAYAVFNYNLFRVCTLSCASDAATAGRFVASAVATLMRADTEPISLICGLTWELADLMHVMAGQREPQFARAPDDEEYSAEQELGETHLHAFFSAASLGEHQRALNVLHAFISAPEHEGNEVAPEGNALIFYCNAMVSSAYTAASAMAEPWSLFQ